MSKNIVICCDGTNNEFGTCNTNVIRLAQIAAQDPESQLIYYIPGVGTLPEQGAMTRLGKKFSEARALAFGTDIGDKVTTAYAHLMDVWRPGDKVFLFGFSRGAYTVRVLAGLLHSFGLLPKGNIHLLPYVMRLYSSLRRLRSDAYWDLCDNFRWTFARPIAESDSRRFSIHFLGLWDTVSSVGWVWNPASYPFTAGNPSVASIRHAVSLDERRSFFRQNLVRPQKSQDVEELWFPGVHADVGGGYPESEGGLWRESFNWMVDNARQKGFLVEQNRLDEVLSKSPTANNAWAEPAHESLRGIWWSAEIFPKLIYSSSKKRRAPKFGLGRNRRIPEGSVIHKSALARLRGTTYSPSNLSEAFRSRVKSLPMIPETLRYTP